jgi:hypothetical protein
VAFVQSDQKTSAAARITGIWARSAWLPTFLCIIPSIKLD